MEAKFLDTRENKEGRGVSFLLGPISSLRHLPQFQKMSPPAECSDWRVAMPLGELGKMAPGHRA